MTAPPRNRPAFGRLLSHWRGLRGLTQLALALRVATTTRHLSYVENGRSRPGRDLVLRLADALDVPLRTRNELLVAAGLPAEFPANELESAMLAPYRRAVVRLIESLHPFPAFVLDSMFNLQEANEIGRRMIPELASGARVNLIDTFLAPGPWRTQIVNFDEVAWAWHARFLRTTASLPAEDRELVLLRARIEGYLRSVPRPAVDGTGELVVCPTLRIGDQTIHTIALTMRFGPARDVTLEELAVDVLYPRDAAAERFFRSFASQH